MKTILTVLLTLLYFCNSAQVGFDVTVWNTQVGIDEMMVYNPEEEEMLATITIEFEGKEFTKDTLVESKDWLTISYASLGITYTEMPISSGTVYAAVMVAAGGQGVTGDFYFISVRNRLQPYEVNIKELGDRINYYGSIIDDVIFWIDFNGYNYVIRSHNKDKGIFLSHWIMDIEGSTERISYYKSDNVCSGKNELIQKHSIGWTVEDTDGDAYMEFYSLVTDGCVPNWQHPTNSTLVVFTTDSGLELKGTTYSLLEDTSELGGNYEASEKLKEHPKLLKQAEAAWEVYIME